MIINVDWEIFHLRFFNNETVFVKEHIEYFEFLTYEGVACIRCCKYKYSNPEENLIFIERYMTDKKNIVKVLYFEEEETEEKPIEEIEAEVVEDGI